MASDLDASNTQDRKARFQQSLMMFRRSISLNEYERQYDILNLKDSRVQFSPKTERHALSRATSSGGPSVQRQWSTSGGGGLPTESDINNLATVFFESYFGCYIRYIIIPVVLIFTLIYTFFHLPVQPKAEIYRSLSATFILLVGVIAQCSFITIWATRRYGLTDLMTFLRYYINSPQAAT